MKVFFVLFCVLTFLAGCSTTTEKNPVGAQAATEQTKSWHPSTLSEQTRETAMKTSRDYFSCIDHELGHYLYRGGDSRHESQALLRRCEERLEPIRRAFAAEGVPERIINRYLKRKRTQAARYVLRNVLSMEAQLKAAKALE